MSGAWHDAKGTRIWLPAEMVIHGATLPRVCARHGAAGRSCRPTRVTFTSKPPLWVYLFLFLGVVPLLIAILVLRKTVACYHWPICEECRRTRRNAITWGVGCLVAWIPAVALSIAIDLGPIPFLVAMFVPPLVALLRLSQCTWNVILKAEVTEDGRAVLLREAHRDFVAALPPLPPATPVTWPPAAVGPAVPAPLPPAPPASASWPDNGQRATNVVIPPWEQPGG